MSKFLVTLPYSSSFIMSAKDFTTFSEIVANSTNVEENYFYDLNGDYVKVLVDKTGAKLSATMIDETPIKPEQYTQLKAYMSKGE